MPNTGPAQEGLLVLEDGSAYEGAIVSPGTRFGEVVFNTSMTGYQEILTDPSYRGQIVVMTQPHIGNYGTAAELGESRQPWVEAFVAHQFTARHSGSGEGSLPPYLREHGIPALHEIDTRSLVRRLRERGAMRGVVTSERSDVAALVDEVRESPPMEGRALVDEVTCAEAYSLLPKGEPRFRLAVYDYGIKSNILRSLLERGAALEVLPARTPASVVRDLGVDGVVLSNGPGDPEPLREMIDAVAELVAADYPGPRHLSRPPAPRARARRQDEQAQVRAPRRQPAGQGPRHRRGRRSPARTTASWSIPTRCPLASTSPR